MQYSNFFSRLNKPRFALSTATFAASGRIKKVFKRRILTATHEDTGILAGNVSFRSRRSGHGRHLGVHSRIVQLNSHDSLECRQSTQNINHARMEPEANRFRHGHSRNSCPYWPVNADLIHSSLLNKNSCKKQYDGRRQEMRGVWEWLQSQTIQAGLVF